MQLRRAALVAALLSAGCASVDPEAVTTDTCPPSDAATFSTVSTVLETRCGTLDCHGNTARPLRIYGQTGLRRPEPDRKDDPTYFSGLGAAPTTNEELLDNALAVCGLEPEKMSAVVAGKADPNTLTFIRKARLTEKHKGGLIWNQGDPGDQCVVAWVKNKTNPEPCALDQSHP